jgi:hypothetical protein
MEKLLVNALNTNLPRDNCAESKQNYILSKRKNICKCINSDVPNKIECICNSKNILTRPADFEETCVIFDLTQNYFGVDSTALLLFGKKVTEIIYPFTDNYDFYRLNYNHRFNFFPVAIVRAHCPSDVVQTINFCVKNNLPMRARGGAHAYEPASLVNYGIILDQRPRKNIVSINHHKKVVQIEAGALLGPIINKLSEQNILIPFGTCVTNGLAGLTLGGGIGFSTREYGLTLDRVINMKVVLANGNVVNTNKKEYPDLFWALRGAGGGNFAVVTDFVFKYVEAKWVTIFTLYYNFADTKKLFKVWQKWAPFINSKLTAELDIFNKFQPVIVTGQLQPGISPASDQELLIELIKPLLDLNLQTDFSIKTASLTEAAKYFGQGSYARPLFFYNKSDFNFNQLPDEAIDTIIYYMGLLNKNQTHNKTEIDALGGNFSKIPSNATAFPSRSAIYWLQYTSLWDIPEQQESSMAWLKKYYAALRPFFPKKRKYVNALDYDVPRLLALKSYYGENLPDLIKIKQKYDPTNFFKFEQSIPTVDEFDLDISNKN